jgi:site-specific DNA recombinase
MKAAIYSRFSTDRQSETSIADQVRVCTEYADREGWQVFELYQDAGISGAAMGNRPGFQAMRADAMAGKFDVLLVTDTTRLARSQELAPLIERLRYQGVRVIGAQDSFDSAAGTADMQAGLSGIMSVEFRRMIKARTHAALETRAKEKRPTGGRAYGYRDGAVDKGEAFIVREMYGRFADGASCRAIAVDLNARRIPSPGSSWNRTKRRAGGWMGSGVRVILRNERYRGVVHWNVSEWRKDPDTGKRKRVVRPRSEWITHTDESLRIVSDELWQRAQRRLDPAKDDARLKAGGRPKYLLSGLLRCSECGANYAIMDKSSYGCHSHFDGESCANAIRVKKQQIEDVLLRGPETGLAALLAPERVARMAKEMQAYYQERVQALQTRATEAPQELRELAARIERLRERLRKGDPDMTPDELQATIDRAEEKRRELEAHQPSVKASAKVLSVLPRAAELYRRQVVEGLDGNQREALKARVFLREWFSGVIRLEPLPGGGLMAHWNENASALLRASEHVVAGAGFEPATFGL